MSRGKRVVLFLIALILLSVISYLWHGTLLPKSATATVIFTSLVMISFITLFLEH